MKETLKRTTEPIAKVARLKAVHCRNPEVYDTFSEFGKKQCDLSELQCAAVDERNLQACQELDISLSRVLTLRTAYLCRLTSLRAVGTGLSTLDTRFLRNLRVLDLHNCPISVLHVSHLTALENLNVAYTGITWLEFDSLEHLYELDIRYTAIATLETAYLPYLRVLMACKTRLKFLDIQPLYQLEELYLNDSPIQYLKAADLTALKKLYVPSTRITQFNARPFQALLKLSLESSAVEYVDLRYLTDLQVFYCAKGVKALDLSHCVKLEQLKLSCALVCKISMPPGALLSLLDIAGAGVRYLDLRKRRCCRSPVFENTQLVICGKK